MLNQVQKENNLNFLYLIFFFTSALQAWNVLEQFSNNLPLKNFMEMFRAGYPANEIYKRVRKRERKRRKKGVCKDETPRDGSYIK